MRTASHFYMATRVKEKFCSNSTTGNRTSRCQHGLYQVCNILLHLTIVFDTSNGNGESYEHFKVPGGTSVHRRSCVLLKKTIQRYSNNLQQVLRPLQRTDVAIRWERVYLLQIILTISATS